MKAFHIAAVCAAAATAALLSAPAAAAGSPAGYSVTTVSLLTNDLDFSRATNEFLVAVPSLAGVGLGNTITHVSLSGQILSSTFVGSEPTKLAVSSDGSTAYAGMAGAPTVRRYDVINRSAGQTFALGDTWYHGPSYAEDIAVKPGTNDTIAVALRNSCCSPRHDGVAIYKNGQMLTNKTPGHTGSNTIEFGSDGTLYGYNNETTEFGFRKMAVNDSGVTVTSVTSSGIYGFGPQIIYDGGLIFSSSGVVVDPANGVQLGTFATGGAAFVPSSADGIAYALSSAGVLTVFDLETFVPMKTYDLSSVLPSIGYYGNGYSELVVGSGGVLAARTADKVFLLTPVPEPSTVMLLLLGLTAAGVMARRRQSS